MAESATNPFVAEVLQAVAKQQATDKTEVELATPKLPRRLRQFVGFIHELTEERTWRIYTCLELDKGVDVVADEVLYHCKQEPSKEDGLVRDVVVVAHDAHVLYWSHRPPDATSGPDGGYPYPE
jgi:hypothetical protein